MLMLNSTQSLYEIQNKVFNSNTTVIKVIDKRKIAIIYSRKKKKEYYINELLRGEYLWKI